MQKIQNKKKNIKKTKKTDYNVAFRKIEVTVVQKYTTKI